MLRIITSYSDLDERKLMDLYAEGNEENGEELYPNLDRQQAVALAERDFLAFLRDQFFTWPSPRYFILEEAGEWVSALRLNEVEPGLHYLEALETRPDMRRRGCAARLLNEVIAYLKSQGPFCLRDSVDKGNQASLATHFACGFQIVSETGHNPLYDTDNPYCYSLEYRHSQAKA